jgi:exodeoxyribonuclease VII large subunit
VLVQQRYQQRRGFVDSYRLPSLMNIEFRVSNPDISGPVWAVGALMQAIADALASRFNPVAVEGEISGFSRAASGHCYFNLKDASGQIRCALFRRSADALSFAPRDGMRVQVRGKLDVYGPRGDLQLIVDRMQATGAGQLYEEFVRLKARLEAQGLFDTDRKRALPSVVRRIGVVTSLGAAALRDVATALSRRVPHIEVVLFPASVQGAQAPGEIVDALQAAYRAHGDQDSPARCDVLLLVRGGGSLEDLWSFNDERVVQAVVRAPMPLVCGVGHETDFTLADFAADLRAPTPTAAAELCAPDRQSQCRELDAWADALSDASTRQLERQAQRLDRCAAQLGRPSARLADAQRQLVTLQHRLQGGCAVWQQGQRHGLERASERLGRLRERALQPHTHRLDRLAQALSLMDPSLPLQRGYALLTDTEGHLLSSVQGVQGGAVVQAALADGDLALTVQSVKPRSGSA